MLSMMQRSHTMNSGSTPLPSVCFSRWLAWWFWKNNMYHLLLQHHPPGFNFLVSSRWPLTLFTCSYSPQSLCCFVPSPLGLNSYSAGYGSCCASVDLFSFPVGFGELSRQLFPGLYPLRLCFCLISVFYRDFILYSFYQPAWKVHITYFGWFYI